MVYPGFTDLPALALELIASKVGKDGAANLRLVGKDCRSAVSVTLHQLSPCKTITDEQLAFLWTCFPNISSLNISGCNNLTDAALIDLQRLSQSLTVLDMRKSRDWMSLIEYGRMFLPNITDLSSIGQLSKLEVLNLDGCKNATVDSLLVLSNLLLLKDLQMFKADITEVHVRAFAQMSSLESLDLTDCLNDREHDSLSVPLVAMLSALPRLNFLGLDVCYIGDGLLRALLNFPSLEVSLEGSVGADSVTVSTLLAILACENLRYRALKSFALASLGYNDEEEVLQLGGLELVLKCVFPKDDELLYFEALPALIRMVDNSADVQNALLETGIVSLLHAALCRDECFDHPGGVDMASLLLALCGRNNVFALGLVRESGGMAKVIDALVANPSSLETETLSVALAKLRMETPNIHVEIGDAISRLKLAISSSVGKPSEDQKAHIQALTVLVSGNVVSCEAFLHFDGVQIIVDVLKQAEATQTCVSLTCSFITTLVESHLGYRKFWCAVPGLLQTLAKLSAEAAEFAASAEKEMDVLYKQQIDEVIKALSS